jgi:hypothetical protein
MQAPCLPCYSGPQMYMYIRFMAGCLWPWLPCSVSLVYIVAGQGGLLALLPLAALICLSSVHCCRAGWFGGPANPGCPALSLVYFAAGLGGLLALLIQAALFCL